MDNTYIISGTSGLDHTHLRYLMNQKGFKEIPCIKAMEISRKLDDRWELKKRGQSFQKYPSNVGFVWAELWNQLQHEKALYNVNCSVKNLLTNKTAIANKLNLSFNLKERFPEIASKHLSRTRDLKDVSIIENEVIIVKPIGTYSGNGIIIVTNNQELQMAKEQCKRYKGAIACDYIKNPGLFQGRKFHLRMFLLLLSEKDSLGVPFWSFCNKGLIVTAKDLYMNKDYNNQNIHDTHLRSTPDHYIWPQDCRYSIDIIESLQNQMKSIANHVAQLGGDIKPYPDTKYGFEVFGMDFLIDMENEDRPNVILLEVNEKAKYRTEELIEKNSPKFSQLCVEYFDWVYDNAISPLLELSRKVPT